MGDRKIHYAMMCQNELHDIVPNIEKALPFVDSVTVVDGGSKDGTIMYFRNWQKKEPKIRFYISPWEDDFPKQRNKYVSLVAEIAEQGDWLLTCFDDKTEVLTSNGWKPFKDVNIDEDEFLTLNKETHVLEWQRASRKIENRFKGNLLEYSDKSCDFAVTGNHNMYVKRKYSNWSPEDIETSKNINLFELVQAEELINSGKGRMLRAASWNSEGGKEYVPGISNVKFARILGWYMSEGWSYMNGHRKKIQFSQTKEPTRTELIDLLESCGLNIIYNSGRRSDTITVYNHKLFDILQEFGKTSWEKYLPRWVKDESQEFLINFLETYIKGDGSTKSNNFIDYSMFYTTSKTLAGDVQEICMKLGLRCTVSEREPTIGGYNDRGQVIEGKRVCFNGTISSNKEVVVDFNNMVPLPYDGIVRCVTVPNNTLCIRRNGRTLICGNCDPDEYFEDLTFEKLHKAADKAEELGRNMIGFQCRSVSLGGPERVWENLDDYWKHLMIRWDPNFHYTGYKCHEGKGGVPHNIMNTALIYEHVKQENVIWLRGHRNLWHGGGGPNLGSKNPIWVQLRKIAKEKLGIEAWHDYYDYVLKGNIDQEIKDLYINHMLEGTPDGGPNCWKTEPWDGASEVREMYKTYFRVLHPEEQPEELREVLIP